MGGFENATKVCRSRCIRCVLFFWKDVLKKKEVKQPPPSSFTLLLLSPLLDIEPRTRARTCVANKNKMRKKVDSRIRTLVENGVKLNERTLFVVVGDNAREQIVNIRHMLSKAVVKRDRTCCGVTRKIYT